MAKKRTVKPFYTKRAQHLSAQIPQMRTQRDILALHDAVDTEIRIQREAHVERMEAKFGRSALVYVPAFILDKILEQRYGA